MFNDDLNDGFFAQIIFIANSFSGDFSLSPLFVVHFFRFLIISPFFLSFYYDLPAFVDAFVFLLYILPFMANSRRRMFGYLPILFLFFPLLFSYRTVLGMFGMAYLYVCLFSKIVEYRLFLFSALLANLSSGMVLSWGICVASSFSYFRQNYKFFDVIFFIVCIGFLGSLVHKYEFMFASQGALDNGGAVERSTLVVSYANDQFARFFFYVALTLLILVILIFGALSKFFTFRRWMFFFGSVPVMFFEGVGLVSYLVCIIVFVSNNISFTERYYVERKN